MTPDPWRWTFHAPSGCYTSPVYEEHVADLAGRIGCGPGPWPTVSSIGTPIRHSIRMSSLGTLGCAVTEILAAQLLQIDPTHWNEWELVAAVPRTYGQAQDIFWVARPGGAGRINPIAAVGGAINIFGSGAPVAPVGPLDPAPTPEELPLEPRPPLTWEQRENRVAWVLANFTDGELAYLYKVAHDARGLRRDKVDEVVRREQRSL